MAVYVRVVFGCPVLCEPLAGLPLKIAFFEMVVVSLGNVPKIAES